MVLSSCKVEGFEFELEDDMESLSEGKVCCLSGEGGGKSGYSNVYLLLESWSQSLSWME